MKQHAIVIKLQKKQIANDVLTECAIVGRTLQLSAEGEELGGNIMNPYGDLTRPVMARGMTEGFAEVKRVCQRYLVMGKVTDDNRLEKIDERKTVEEIIRDGKGRYDLVQHTTYLIGISSDQKVTLYSVHGNEIGTVNGNGIIEYSPAFSGPISLKTEAASVKVTYLHGEFGELDLYLEMPASFNIGMTESIKSHSHRMIVDHIMFLIMFNQYPEKAGLYKDRFTTDIEGLRQALQARTAFGRHAEDWS